MSGWVGPRPGEVTGLQLGQARPPNHGPNARLGHNCKISVLAWASDRLALTRSIDIAISDDV